MQRLTRLIDVVREIEDLERSAIDAISITPGATGYDVRISVHLFLPASENPKLPDGCTMTGVQHWPDILRMIDWRVPAWDQVLEVVNDPELSKPENLGSMEAAERAIVRNGAPSESESGKHWVIVTHGAPRSSERKEWIARMVKIGQ